MMTCPSDSEDRMVSNTKLLSSCALRHTLVQTLEKPECMNQFTLLAVQGEHVVKSPVCSGKALFFFYALTSNTSLQ